MMWYFLIGLIYTIINGMVRKLDTDDDFLLPMVWFLLWPIAFISLFFVGMKKLISKIK
jgi:hypothetical protein